jgi:paraquat-inducible protein B
LQFVSGEHNAGKNVPELIARGLRGQLQTVSLVTGQAIIDFNFYPDTPVRLFGAEAGVMELPTIPSDIEQLKVNVTSLLAKINKLPLEDERRHHQGHRGRDQLLKMPTAS